ncbi:hypothetical protein AFK49_001685 [Corynebacterium ulcerans]|nr:hypothetical protein [Corynebacterium ulcerans]OAG69741.1 hypothetical protein AFK49_001685 [Corynebacterium ulcerans]
MMKRKEQIDHLVERFLGTQALSTRAVEVAYRRNATEFLTWAGRKDRPEVLAEVVTESNIGTFMKNKRGHEAPRTVRATRGLLRRLGVFVGTLQDETGVVGKRMSVEPYTRRELELMAGWAISGSCLWRLACPQACVRRKWIFCGGLR